MTAKALKQVSDRFSLFNDGRKLSANKRNYIIKAVQAMINSPRTKELLRLGEAYGYYGHQSRQRANKLSIGETEVIMINGRPVVVENVPSNRTVSITCSDDGIVEHTQEFLDTDTGRIALGLHNSRAGGWSWATGGQDTREASITTSYHGMD
ncbi:head processing protein, partial [Vibrio diabolicus]|nr:head processing protein [Vibrio diabolicus]